MKFWIAVPKTRQQINPDKGSLVVWFSHFLASEWNTIWCRIIIIILFYNNNRYSIDASKIDILTITVLLQSEKSQIKILGNNFLATYKWNKLSVPFHAMIIATRLVRHVANVESSCNHISRVAICPIIVLHLMAFRG